MPEINSFEQIEEIKKAGFDSTFFSWTNKQNAIAITEKANALGLEVEGIHAPFDKINSVWVEGDDGDDFVEELRTCINTAAKLHIPVVIIHTCRGTDVPKTSPIGLLRFRKIIIESERKGIKLAFENTEIIRHLSLILDYFKSENVGYCYDCGHENCFTPGFRFLKLFGERTFFLHIHDNLGVGETKEIHWRDDIHKIPFDGSIDFNRVCSDIKQSGYKGTLMLEVSNLYNFYDDLSISEFYKKAYHSANALRDMIDKEV